MHSSILCICKLRFQRLKDDRFIEMMMCSFNILDHTVQMDIQRITGQPEYVPKEPRELANRIFTTCYMASENSSNDTRNRAAQLANQIGWSVCFVVE